MKALALERISLTVVDLDAQVAFYTAALGFERVGPTTVAEAALATLYGAARVTLVNLRRGRQWLELAAFAPPGDAYPQNRHSNDLWFQHLALVCDDIDAAYARLSRHPHGVISRTGPQRLPGGIVAYKFRDPEGHPLELIRFPTPDPQSVGGIDHSAISVADAERSISFYTQELGLTVTSRQVNSGPGQEAMDDLDGVVVDVVGLAPRAATPHVELLAYRVPRGRAADAQGSAAARGPAAAHGPIATGGSTSVVKPPADARPLAVVQRPADVAASRLVLRVDTLALERRAVRLADGSRAALIHDPDGHALLLLDGPA